MVFIFVIPHIETERPSCPQGFTLSKGNSCYLIATDLVAWEEASDRCQQLGANLVAIETKSEQRYLVNNIRKLPGMYIKET